MWLTQASGRARGEPVPFRPRHPHTPYQSVSARARNALVD
jgi:hypothetical protein